MEKLGFFGFILLFLFSCNSKNESSTETRPPNIILIMADDLGYETLGVNGSNSYLTPNLDQMAAQGMRFQNCYSTPLCTPSRVQIMTGKYNFRNYIGFGLLDKQEKTFGHYMKDLGYRTYVAGKWQLLGNTYQQELAGNKIGSLPEEAGFEDYCLWQVDTLGSRYKSPVVSIKGKGVVEFKDKYGPDLFVDHIEEFMKTNREHPFFVYYPMVLTHDPFVPTPENPEFAHFDNASKTNDPKYFGEMVTYMDKLVGRIIDHTETLGIQEHTLILFVGDNGTDRDVISRFYEDTIQGDKGYTTAAGTHVPFIAHWKGKIKPESSNDNLVDFTDFLPTLVEAAKGEKLDVNQTDGLSFYPQLVNEKGQARDWIFCDYSPNWGKFEPKRYVQDKNWKYYNNGELYNLNEDRMEKQPLNVNAQDSFVQQRVSVFQKVLESYQ
ncbi:sulfatase-like hydrolase/transferase [Muricauda sp. 2012CJ35-5]|uniref:Sulfatase-like hydrolase/transferase n=1 Tax=Flagellimonas spongiicola TaxID=2942208 RepID=A0ABT0PU39_9FLAO|nr:sulfatase-like hydrolase/transferase [Allomuricauda spongiicola]MCL6274907.1 sulfatase-like hydrolase/transferase [Allomuricauda spongiicola]